MGGEVISLGSQQQGGGEGGKISSSQQQKGAKSHNFEFCQQKQTLISPSAVPPSPEYQPVCSHGGQNPRQGKHGAERGSKFP